MQLLLGEKCRVRVLRLHDAVRMRVVCLVAVGIISAAPDWLAA